MAVGADLENLDPDAIATSIAGCDAVVFAAGAGPGSGPARKRTVDYGRAVKLIEACKSDGIRRYLMVSAMASATEARGPEMRPYYEAKLEADQALAASGLDYTIARPGRLTDDPGTGLIEAAEQLERIAGSPATPWPRPWSPASTPTARSASRSTCSAARHRSRRPSRPFRWAARRTPEGQLGVTGASGFLGRAVCDELLQRDHEVHALVRREGRTRARPRSPATSPTRLPRRASVRRARVRRPSRGRDRLAARPGQDPRGQCEGTAP